MILCPGEYFLRVPKLLFTNRNIPLRQQDKIFGLARISLRSFQPNNYVVPHMFLFLAFIKIVDSEFYDDVKNKELTLLEVQERYLMTIGINKNEKTEHELIWMEVYLVNFYHNFIESEYSRTKLYEYDQESGSNRLLVDSIVNKQKNSSFLEILEDIHGGRGAGNLDLGYFLSRLELLESLET